MPSALPGQFGTHVRSTTRPGLAVRDTQGVHLSGVEVHNFCRVSPNAKVFIKPCPAQCHPSQCRPS
ncbi:hypothetical protein AL532_27785 [Pseudomonas monteilii]|nr:hypothetical protein AL532_27785 [Pseudomonas monteilii]QIG17537.1 hypothetical protein FY041_07040 [Pseudomonas monteilii]QIG22794.1 hypothetical protein FY043_07035 [Pseudomonas monteilii]